MSDTTIKNQMPVQPTQTGASAQTVPAAQQAPVNETAFDVEQTGAPAETTNVAGMDTFVPSSDASVEDLNAQMQAIQTNNDALRESEATTQGTIDTYSTRVENQNNYIDELNNKNNELTARNTVLQGELDGLYSDLSNIEATIADLNSQINAASGFIGGLVNGFNSLFGNGVDVNSLRRQLGVAEANKISIEASIATKEDELEKNGGTITRNKASIERTENYRNANEDIIAQQEAELAKIQEMYKNGELTLEQLQAMSEAAIKAEAEKNGNDGQPSASQVQGTTAVITDILENGELNTDSANAIGDGVKAQDTSTGEFDAEAFKPAYEQAGFNPDEIGARIEIIEAIANYAEIGLDFDPVMLESANVIQLDAIVESAIVQDVMKTTSTKFVGKAANFTSKKEMQEYSDSVDEFISAYSALNSYYKTNNVNDLEVQAFLNLGGDMVNKMGQGYVYGISEVQELTNSTGIMMTTLKTKVSSDEVAGKSANAEFEESKHKTDDAINQAEGRLQEQDEDTIGEFRTEFLNLTNKYNHSNSDSARQVSINAMNALYERALNAENGVNKDPFRNNLNVAA